MQAGIDEAGIICDETIISLVVARCMQRLGMLSSRKDFSEIIRTLSL
jgi:hypothetical protein